MKCSFFSKTSLDIFKSFTAKFNIVGSTLTKNSFSKVFSLLNVTLAFTVYNPGLYVSTLFSVITILLVIFLPLISVAANCKAFIGLNGSPSKTITSLPLNDDLSKTSSFLSSSLLLLLLFTSLVELLLLLLLLLAIVVSPLFELFNPLDGLLL